MQPAQFGSGIVCSPPVATPHRTGLGAHPRGRGLAALLLAVSGLACHGPTAPSPQGVGANGTPGRPPSRVRIESGWDEQPVTHAQVTVGGRTWQPDATGTIVFDQDVHGQDIDIVATGYLPRQTKVTIATLTLWPAANPEEAEAIRAMAYKDDNSGLFRPDSPDYRITVDDGGDMPNSAAVAAAQQVDRSATRLSQLIGPRAAAPWFQVFTRFGYEPFEMLIDANQTTTTCPTPWGFCRHAGPYFGVSMVRERAGQPDVALRALTHILLRANPLPGLMNLQQPADDLSLLEQQTIRMIFKRQVGNHWPDSDRQ